MVTNALKCVLLILALGCYKSIEQSGSCRSIVLVPNAVSDNPDMLMSFYTNDSLQCKQQCLYVNSCKMSSWNKISQTCYMFSSADNSITTDVNTELYYVMTTDCPCLSQQASEWTPIQYNPVLSKFSLVLLNETDLVNCTAANLNYSFVFDFSNPGRCYQNTGYGFNRFNFSEKTYIYVNLDIFFGKCFIEIKQISLPTNYITYTPISPTSPATTYSSFQLNLMSWDFQPLVLRPAYIVIVGLGGACLLMTVLAVVTLCQGRLDGGGGTSRKHVMNNYSEENASEPMEIRNQMYDTDTKDEGVDLTLPHQGEYFNRAEMMD